MKKNSASKYCVSRLQENKNWQGWMYQLWCMAHDLAIKDSSYRDAYDRDRAVFRLITRVMNIPKTDDLQEIVRRWHTAK